MFSTLYPKHFTVRATLTFLRMRSDIFDNEFHIPEKNVTAPVKMMNFFSNEVSDVVIATYRT